MFCFRRPRHLLATFEAIIEEASVIDVHLPHMEAMREAVRKAQEWSSKVDTIQVWWSDHSSVLTSRSADDPRNHVLCSQGGQHYPYLDVLEALLTKGRPIPVRLDQLPVLESQVGSAKSWRERTARTFLKKNSTYSLLDVLSPRSEVGQCCLRHFRRLCE